MMRTKLTDRYDGCWFEIQPNRWVNDETWEQAVEWISSTCGLPRSEVEARFAPLTEATFEAE